MNSENETRNTVPVISSELLPGETPKAFAAFRRYLEMGSHRSITALAEELECGTTQLYRWSAAFCWTARAAQHEAQAAAVTDASKTAALTAHALSTAASEMNLRERELGARAELLAIVTDALGAWREAGHKCRSLDGIARALLIAFKLGRLDRPEPAHEPVPRSGPHWDELERLLDHAYGNRLQAQTTEVPPAPPTTTPDSTSLTGDQSINL